MWKKNVGMVFMLFLVSIMFVYGCAIIFEPDQTLNDKFIPVRLRTTFDLGSLLQDDYLIENGSVCVFFILPNTIVYSEIPILAIYSNISRTFVLETIITNTKENASRVLLLAMIKDNLNASSNILEWLFEEQTYKKEYYAITNPDNLYNTKDALKLTFIESSKVKSYSNVYITKLVSNIIAIGGIISITQTNQSGIQVVVYTNYTNVPVYSTTNYYTSVIEGALPINNAHLSIRVTESSKIFTYSITSNMTLNLTNARPVQQILSMLYLPELNNYIPLMYYAPPNSP